MPIGFDEIEVDPTPAGIVVTLKFREKLDKADYEMFVPMIESQMRNGSPIRLLAELHDLRGGRPAHFGKTQNLRPNTSMTLNGWPWW